MGYGRYLAMRALNSVIVLIVALFIASIAFNSLAEVNVKEMVSARLQASKQQLAQQHRQLSDVVAALMQEFKEINVKVTYKDKTIDCYEFAKKLSEGTLEINDTRIIEAIADRCYTEYFKYREYSRWGLNLPIYIRVFYYVYKTLTLDFGEAKLKYPQFGTSDVKTMVLTAMARTALLFTTAYMINVALSIFIGLQMARRVGSVLDRGVSVVAMISASLPMFWVGMLMIYLFAYVFKLFPSVAYEKIPDEIAGNVFEQLKWWLWHLAVPIMTIVLVGFGGGAYSTRNLVISIMQEDFVTTARAKGVPERKVVYGHVLRAASPPIVTSISLGFIGTFFGAIISEVVFQWPGMGRLYYTALEQADIPVLMANTFMFVFLFVIVRFILEIIYGFLDPRIRASR
ncbi:MAG: hypothetical protein DRI01_08190 [Chloroflexi bacterium]|nr:MAG: hypothetical protein DRI01_08190 [Chloroflexota bacterium]